MSKRLKMGPGGHQQSITHTFHTWMLCKLLTWPSTDRLELSFLYSMETAAEQQSDAVK